MQETPLPAAWPMPSDELLRIRELRNLDVLDTSPDASFDGIAEIAAEILAVPFAAVSLVDTDRQWFKARVGIEACQTGRDASFCAHAIMSYRTLVVEDALEDPCFRNNPLVTNAPHVRFYAGVPLVTSGNRAVGALCVMDVVPRVIEARKIRLLERLARLTVNELEARRA